MRKPHTKSRLGCRTCKRRKIKCDETTPVCNNCTRFGVPCGYDLSHPLPLRTSPSVTRESPRRGRPRSNWTLWAEQISASSSARAVNPLLSDSCFCDIPRLNVDDLRLFHNYLDSTSRTVADNSHDRLWREGVPKLGFEYPCVLHLMLSLSALQLSREMPGQAARYEKLAERHSTTALKAATALMREMTRENCPAVYVSAALICFNSFAQGPSEGNLLLVADDGQVPWLALIRGVRLVVSTMGWSSVFSGALADYYPQPSSGPQQEQQDKHESLTPSSLVATEDWRGSLEKVRDLVAVLPNQQCREVYAREIETLTGCLEATFGAGQDARVGTAGEMQVVMAWVYSVQDEFVERLGQRHPAALVILGHFCVLLRTLEKYWFMREWAKHLMTEILRATDDGCQEWLAWPIRYLWGVAP